MENTEIGLTKIEIDNLLEKGFIFEIRPREFQFLDRDESENIIFIENGR